jgi:hypothetical protein
MRVILAAAAALAAITVSGCDINTGPPKTAKVECNCTAPAAPPAGMRGSEPPPAEPYHHHSYRRPHESGYASWHGGHSHYWRREYAETSVFTYDYHSGSSTYYAGSHGGGSSGASAYAYAEAGGYAGAGAYAGGGAHGGGYRVVDRGWVDGYGRGHDGGAPAGAPAHYETHGDRGRLHPWHGYDADCPDDPRH